MVSGVIQTMGKSEGSLIGRYEFAKGCYYIAIIAVGVAAISNFGFLKVSPVLSLALMLSMGERRWVWLISGAAGVPFAIWLVVVVFLGRLLP